jgi:hypothetical protein
MRDIENLQIKFNCQKKAFINDILNQITYLPCSQYLGFQVQIKEIFFIRRLFGVFNLSHHLHSHISQVLISA